MDNILARIVQWSNVTIDRITDYIKTTISTSFALCRLVLNRIDSTVTYILIMGVLIATLLIVIESALMTSAPDSYSYAMFLTVTYNIVASIIIMLVTLCELIAPAVTTIEDVIKFLEGKTTTWPNYKNVFRNSIPLVTEDEVSKIIKDVVNCKLNINSAWDVTVAWVKWIAGKQCCNIVKMSWGPSLIHTITNATLYPFFNGEADPYLLSTNINASCAVSDVYTTAQTVCVISTFPYLLFYIIIFVTILWLTISFELLQLLATVFSPILFFLH